MSWVTGNPVSVQLIHRISSQIVFQSRIQDKNTLNLKTSECAFSSV